MSQPATIQPDHATSNADHALATRWADAMSYKAEAWPAGCYFDRVSGCGFMVGFLPQLRRWDRYFFFAKKNKNYFPMNSIQQFWVGEQFSSVQSQFLESGSVLQPLVLISNWRPSVPLISCCSNWLPSHQFMSQLPTGSSSAKV